MDEIDSKDDDHVNQIWDNKLETEKLKHHLIN